MLEALLGGGGGVVLARLETKLDGLGERLSVVHSDVQVLKAKDGEATRRSDRFLGEEWPRLEAVVTDTARQLSVVVATIGSLADSMKTLEARVDRGDAQIADLRRLQSDVSDLKAVDKKVGEDLEALKKSFNRWGGGLAVAFIVGGALWGALGVHVSTEAPAATQAVPAQVPVYVMPPTAPVSPTAPNRPRVR